MVAPCGLPGWLGGAWSGTRSGEVRAGGVHRDGDVGGAGAVLLASVGRSGGGAVGGSVQERVQGPLEQGGGFVDVPDLCVVAPGDVPVRANEEGSGLGDRADLLPVAVGVDGTRFANDDGLEERQLELGRVVLRGRAGGAGEQRHLSLAGDVQGGDAATSGADETGVRELGGGSG